MCVIYMATCAGFMYSYKCVYRDYMQRGKDSKNNAKNLHLAYFRGRDQVSLCMHAPFPFWSYISQYVSANPSFS